MRSWDLIKIIKFLIIIFFLIGFNSCASSQAERKRCGLMGCERPEIHQHPARVKKTPIRETREKNVKAESYKKRIRRSKER